MKPSIAVRKLTILGLLQKWTYCFALQKEGAAGVDEKELLPGVQANTDYFEEEQKVNELKNEVAELDIVLISEQLKELEVWKLQSHSSLLM